MDQRKTQGRDAEDAVRKSHCLRDTRWPQTRRLLTWLLLLHPSAEKDMLGEGASHPTDGVMFITGSLWARADSSGISGTPPLAPVHSGFSSASSKRLCARQECSRALPDISHDLHTMCIMCRGSCTVSLRC
ncbi:hypothetical protein E2C01_066431 [Portunus trituberculatus]|uniref:Uncharacterized protein n=1 Tax=Portunus trituberculatus TaxID=210409 RepID=A0A5B7HSB2_PORTR|nr:hypothetical protein [Portunus trituberculatus]